ncbi:RNA-binding protein [Caminicella sporogenes DSM 14501]|uniref:RNA-binding protein n=1 Tax=Caminicella sporogenes DSM 14501 TaxID=1121266 RepID=A0A1M6LV19_9FIRM|nr:ribosome assembly RNA-binding protein YhbY [Caminicella sporogenes]RKD27962.1 RNA-binding protein [Caminicella sporogenes]WIF94435.1 ribosome assembly RNA-binding protein YhbY [Caminicella sporogenes]SHJ75049.1 RNA-binding protein [Caminicella sporogenes DSM 14501]
MITSKQRAFLKGLANKIEPITQIGKDGISEAFINQLNDALEARELVKVSIQKNSLLDTKETANKVAKLTNSEFVQAIGRKFVIYRKSKKKPKIDLPK